MVGQANRILVVVLCGLFIGAASPLRRCCAAAGDVSFSLSDATINRPAAAPFTTSLDLVVRVDSLPQVPATAWGLIIDITPLAGSTGNLLFAPSAIVGGAPNLLPALTNPFLDFDREFGGKSYGVAANGGRQLRANGLYLAPASGPAPPVDSFGNLTLPSNRGLAALPLQISGDARGDFLLEIRNDPTVTGVSFLNANGPARHPIGTHHSATIRIIPPTVVDGDFDNNGVYDCLDINALTQAVATGGDVNLFDLNADRILTILDVDAWRIEAGTINLQRPYPIADANLDGVVDVSDFNLWNAHKSLSDTAWCHGNFNADSSVNAGDFAIWNSVRFASSSAPAIVPEPTTGLLSSVLVLFALLCRQFNNE